MIPAGIISADGHVCEPPDCYVDNIEPRYREDAPRIVEQDDGTEAFVVPGMKRPIGLGFIDGAGFGPRERKQRAKMFNEALPLLKQFWEEGPVTHHGDFYDYENVELLPKPMQQPMDIWLGGAADVELRRCGRFGDGGLPSFCTPDMAAAGWKLVNEAADEAERFT